MNRGGTRVNAAGEGRVPQTAVTRVTAVSVGVASVEAEPRTRRGADGKDRAMGRVTHVNPPELHTSPAYSQGTVVEAGRTLYVGGQNGTDADGVITGGAREQSAQALRNVLAVLAAVGATQEDVALLRVHLAADVDLMDAYGAVAEVWGQHPTAVTVLHVHKLGRPEALVEIEAVAAVP